MKEKMPKPTNGERPRSKYWNEMVDIIDKHFPKGQVKERGRALMVLAEIEMLLNSITVPEEKSAPTNGERGETLLNEELK